MSLKNRKLKELRRRAEALTVGQPEVEYLRMPRKSPRILSPKCERGVYQRLKREWRAGR